MEKYILILFILILTTNVSAFEINEIMFDPEGDDNNNEYIEILLGSYANLTGYKIQDSDSEDVLQELKFIDNAFALIVEEDFNYSDIDASIYTTGKTIGNNLNNDGDIIVIKDTNETALDVVHYYEEWGSFNNGKSLCKINNLWKECQATPGKDNFDEEEIEDYSKLYITEFLPNPVGDDDAPMPDGEFIEIFNPTNEELDLLGFYLYDENNRDIIVSETSTIDGTIIGPNNFLVIYMNGEFGFLNNEGLETIKFYDKNKILIDQITYSDSEEGISWARINNIWQRATPSPNQENIEDLDFNSVLKIEKIYLGDDDKAKFGDLIRVKTFIYKTNTTKTSVELWIENDNGETLSKRTKFNIEDKFSNSTITLPLQIIPNCKGKFLDGKYEIILEGLDAEDREEIEIKGITESLCETVVKTKEVVKDVGSKNEIKLLETKVEDGIEPVNIDKNLEFNSVLYESNTMKAQRFAIYFFLFVLICLIIYQSWKKNL